jgi:hypothetical protein
MDAPKFVELTVRAELISEETARRDAEDLAWEHALLAANSMEIELSSDSFQVLFMEIRSKYLELAEHLEYLTFNALVLTRTLLHKGFVELGLDVPATEEEVATLVGTISQTIVSSFAWLLAGQTLLWPRNGTMPDTSVTFNFLQDDIITEQE